ncbi:MAG: adenosylhomocysteinase [Christensenellales bacterium]|jgi:adenosylhomocysteinase
MSDIKDAALAAEGMCKIDWVKEHMPILAAIEKEVAVTKPLDGIRVAVCVHLEAKTARLCLLLKEAGAEVVCTGSNPLSTKDDVAAALAQSGVTVFARHGCDMDTYYRHLNMALDIKPNLVMDDGGDLLEIMLDSRRGLLDTVWAVCEETTTGVARAKARERAGALPIPFMNVNDAMCKHLFDNRYGTGQSAWEGIIRATNLQVSGKTAVVAGYGWCGRGIAGVAAGLGAKVIVTEIDPIKAIEAVMDGHEVMSMDEAAAKGDFFITATGSIDIITRRHFEVMKHGAILANAGHFDVEIDKKALFDMAGQPVRMREYVEAYNLPDGKSVYLLSEGRLVNVTSGDGHSAEIMDMSFAIQALTLIYCAQKRAALKPGVHAVPDDIDRRVAGIRLKAMGVSIDKQTPEQRGYNEGV